LACSLATRYLAFPADSGSALLLFPALFLLGNLALTLFLFQSFLRPHLAYGDRLLHPLGLIDFAETRLDLGEQHADPAGIAAEIVITVTG
jgi:hypothetical protein